ncbi:XkdX family protein [Schinkia azotoformans]|nr:XkdX family protein [Schinkia azotoformans]
MLTFEKIKEYYDKNLWDKSRVAAAVQYGKITEEDYKGITDETYNAA